MSDRIIDFNEIKNKVKDKDVDKFEEYIYSMYYRMTSKAMSEYFINNEKNNLKVLLEGEEVILISDKNIDLTDNELNEFLCSYKKVLEDKKLNIVICENIKKYEY